jgi:glycosyltransferase involved in cell wall biosynthesis
LIIGIVDHRFNQYNDQRNIVGILSEVEYRKVDDIFSAYLKFYRRIKRLAKRCGVSIKLDTLDIDNQFCDFNRNQVDLLYFFNTVSYGDTPWISTFETFLPRFKSILSLDREILIDFPEHVWNWKINKALQALAGDSCKKLIALSKCSATMQRKLFEGMGIYNKNIEKKLAVMHPPQKLLVSHFSDKGVDVQGQIKFIFVGSSFFRKGGMEIVETLKELRDNYHYDLVLTLVSALRIDNYATKEGPEDVKRASQFIQENSDWITHFHRLPNNEVLDLMKRSHIGLLPTYADTYGYSVLEFQAAGCPVITTNVRALPEINDNEKGWVIDVPKDRLGEAIYETPEDRQVISEAIRTGLKQAVHEIFSDRTVIENKSDKAIAGIRDHHSPSDFAARMQKIYLGAIH